MIIPIRCFSCGKPVAQLWEEFKERTEIKVDKTYKQKLFTKILPYNEINYHKKWNSKYIKKRN